MNNKLTEIVFILDRSGSMSGLEADTIGGFNGFIKRQLQLEGNARSTVVLFDDRYEILWSERELSETFLTEKDYYVRGSTALLDAIGNTILTVKHRLQSTAINHRASNVIVVITTDGYENASTEFTYRQINKLIRDQKKKDWQFIFLGANIDEVEEASKLGIDQKDTLKFSCTEEGVNEMYKIMNESVASYREK